MKKKFILTQYLFLLLCTQTILSQTCNEDCFTTSAVASPVRPLIIPRNQGANTARELVGLQEFMHLCNVPETYGVVAMEFEYTRSFRPARIAKQLFGDTSCEVCYDNDQTYLLNFQGSKIQDRNEFALIADNFGLSQDFDGTLALSPRISNLILDIEYYVSLDCWMENAWFRTNLPITHTYWNLFDFGSGTCNPCDIEKIDRNSQNTPFPPCYMASGDNGENNIPVTDDIITALSGEFLFGDMQTPWHYGKFATNCLDKTRLADIDLIFGYDFLCTDYHHLGLYLQATAPTGNAPNAEFIFEPIAGNGHHWGLGGGISSHFTLCDNDYDQNLSIWIVGNIQHLFSDRQVRSFDFKDQGPMSRYMLLKEFDSNGAYTGNMINAINFTTRTVESKFKIMGDASIKFALYNRGMTFDIGYNIWGRSCEEIRLCGKAPLKRATCGPNANTKSPENNQKDNTFGFKGCEGTCTNNFTTETNVNGIQRGFAANPSSTRLNSTQSDATAYNCGTVDNGQFISGTSNGNGTNTLNAGDTANLTWDSTQTTETSLVTTANPGIIPTDVPNGVIFAQSSNPPKLLTVEDLNFVGARSSLTHKIFGYVGYTWYECSLTPFVGIHGEVEFDDRQNCGDSCSNLCSHSDATKDTCINRSINQWGIGIKGGMAF